MTSPIDFDERYKTGNTPWEINRPDLSLIDFVIDTPIAPCRAIDIGCGTGSNVLWLAQQNFTATGYDLSPLAIKQAQEKSAGAEVNCSFINTDFLLDDIADNSFDFAFDRGCFHHIIDHETRLVFAEKVAQILSKDGIWLSLIGNTDETRQGPGPPKLSASQISTAIEPFFTIISLKAHHFDFDHEGIPAMNWVCQMKKRS